MAWFLHLPAGGVLFSLEEGASFLKQMLTWRMVSALMKLLLIVNKQHVFRIVDYPETVEQFTGSLPLLRQKIRKPFSSSTVKN
jgi:hypothetical protein